MKIITLLTFISILSITGNAQTTAAPETGKGGAAFPSGEQFKGTNITYKIILAANNTFGYDVMQNEKLLIHQPTVPAMPGNDGFKTKEGAQKVAELVISKIKKGEMPPTVSIDEMKKLKAIE